jgi:hypothetical protein
VDISRHPNGVVYDKRGNTIHYTYERLGLIDSLFKRKGHIGTVNLETEQVNQQDIFSPNGIDVDLSSDKSTLIVSITLRNSLKILTGIEDGFKETAVIPLGKDGILGHYPDGLIRLDNGDLLVSAFGAGKILYLHRSGNRYLGPVEILKGLGNPTDLALGPSSNGDKTSLYVTTKNWWLLPFKALAKGKVVEITDIDDRIDKARRKLELADESGLKSED